MKTLFLLIIVSVQAAYMRLPVNLVHDLWKNEVITAKVTAINEILSKHPDLDRDEQIAHCLSSFECNLLDTPLHQLQQVHPEIDLTWKNILNILHLSDVLGPNEYYPLQDLFISLILTLWHERWKETGQAAHEDSDGDSVD